MPKTAPTTYASTPNKPEIVCIQVNPIVRASPSGVRSAMIDRVGLNPTLIARSSVSATATAVQRMCTPLHALISPRNGNANNMSDANTPPIKINGRRRPPQNHALSLTSPTIGWARRPASGPASQTRPTCSMERLYFVLRIQLSAEICTHSAKPIAVDGRLRRM